MYAHRHLHTIPSDHLRRAGDVVADLSMVRLARQVRHHHRLAREIRDGLVVVEGGRQ